MIGRRQAEPWWLSWAGERRIKDSYQFSGFGFQFPSKGPAGKIPPMAKTLRIAHPQPRDHALRLHRLRHPATAGVHPGLRRPLGGGVVAADLKFNSFS